MEELDDEELAKLQELLQEAALTVGVMTDWELDFIASMTERVDTYGAKTYVSDKQWGVLDRIQAKLDEHTP